MGGPDAALIQRLRAFAEKPFYTLDAGAWVKTPPEARMALDAADRLDAQAATIATLTAERDALKAATDYMVAEALSLRAERDRLREALAEVASEALSSEIPEGYGPDVSEDPEFHRGYDAAVSRLRALAALQETPDGR